MNDNNAFIRIVYASLAQDLVIAATAVGLVAATSNPHFAWLLLLWGFSAPSSMFKKMKDTTGV